MTEEPISDDEFDEFIQDYLNSRPNYSDHATRVLVIGGIVSFVVMKVLGSDFALSLACVPSAVVEAKEIWRVVSYAILHMNLLHLGVNMWLIWVIGSLYELTAGTRSLLILFVGGVIVGGVTYVPWAYWQGLEALPLAGASGGLAAILAALAVRSPDQEMKLLLMGTWRLPVIVRFLALFEILNAIFRFWPSLAGTTNLGGILFGFAYATFIKRRRNQRFMTR